MNERIRELAKNHLVHEHFSRYGELVEEKQYEFYPDELEDFAQLVIKECEVALSPMLRDMISRGQAVDLIKQHFGVEE